MERGTRRLLFFSLSNGFMLSLSSPIFDTGLVLKASQTKRVEVTARTVRLAKFAFFLRHGKIY